MGRCRSLLPLLLLASAAAPAAGQAAAPAVARDIPYGPDPAQRLDLSLPDASGFPTLIFVHGGSLTHGDKADEDYGAVCAPFPAAGIASSYSATAPAPPSQRSSARTRATWPPWASRPTGSVA